VFHRHNILEVVVYYSTLTMDLLAVPFDHDVEEADFHWDVGDRILTIRLGINAHFSDGVGTYT
jgi:hypothetical protein